MNNQEHTGKRFISQDFIIYKTVAEQAVEMSKLECT